MKGTQKHVNIDLKYEDLNDLRKKLDEVYTRLSNRWMNHESANLKFKQIIFVEPRIESNNGVTRLVIPSKMNFLYEI